MTLKNLTPNYYTHNVENFVYATIFKLNEFKLKLHNFFYEQ